MFEMLVSGALTAANEVLPAMREAHDGALLFTTGTTALLPIPGMSNSGIALAGLRSWPMACTTTSPPRAHDPADR
ncbi:hypothetical protein AB0N06_09185 [Streptomyces sp. NPDC051020]|uniref:hypothetical protein n=1 Tax=Streptomyces sp. NPDC051020 TaxID=3155409 RepID=UPI0034153230